MLNAYTIMMLIIIVISLIVHGNEKGNKKYIIFSCLLMFVLMAFRDLNSIGIDSTSSYKHTFKIIGKQSFSQIFSGFDGFNFGFEIFLKLVYVVFGGNYQFVVIIISAFCLWSFAHLIIKYSASPITSICAYWGLIFYITMFDQLKQAIAMSILIYAFDAVFEKKPIKFYVLVVVAALFHTPALVFLPVYLLASVRIPDRYVILLSAGLFALIYIFRSSIVKLMMESYRYADQADQYASKEVQFIGGSVIVYLVIILVCYLFRKPDRKSDFLYTLLFRMMIFATILLTFCYYNNIFKRLSDYYAYFCVVLITLPFETTVSEDLPPAILSSQSAVKSIGKVVFCSYAVVYFAMYIMNHSNNFLPFKFFW